MKYLLRLIGAFALSNVVGVALCWLASTVLMLVMTLFPIIIKGTFSFSFHEVVQDVYHNQLIPGWGFYSSIINRPDFSARLTAFIATILLTIALVVLGYIIFWTKTFLVKSSKFIAVLAELALLAHTLYAIFFMFTSEGYTKVGIEKGFGFYLVAVVLSIILLIINFGNAIFMWEEQISEG